MTLHNRNRTGRSAFTLMEMLVVVAILVVLAGAGGIIYMRYLEEAKKDTARVQAITLADQASMYRIKYGDYPATLADLAQPGQDGSTPYIEVSALIDPWQRPYQYDPQGTRNSGLKPDVWSDGPEPGNPLSIVGNWKTLTGGVGGN